MDRALIDTSFLYALYSTKDRSHAQAITFARDSDLLAIIPDVVLPEVTFLFGRAGGLPVVLAFLEAFCNTQPLLDCLSLDDILQARGIMAEYYDAHLDFVDCCIMVAAERLGVTRVCTYDRRDFAIFRPKHCDYLEMLP